MFPRLRLATDILIIGGGVAGLWLLDDLRRAGRAALLVERHALGHGQTVASQGIIHGGLKYTLSGEMNESARAIRDMPDLWRQCLLGQSAPDLSAVQVRSEYCHLWRTGSFMSMVGMIGARVGLRTRPIHLPKADWPDALRNCGDVFRLDEQVLDPASLLAALAQPHRDRLILGQVTALADTVAVEHAGRSLEIAPRVVVLTAGEGNQALRQLAGLSPDLMQRRPLHMVMARGPLPSLNGHCTDGAKTRVTITTDRDAAGRTVWQIGGQVSEDGVKLDRAALVAHAKREVTASLPGIKLDGVEWSTYRVDRAENATTGGRRPEDAFARREGNVITAWPTKLALAPHLSSMVAKLLDDAVASDDLPPNDWPRPAVAAPPWQTESQWLA